MSKAFQIKDFPDYYITDAGDVYSRYVGYKHNPQGRIHKLKSFFYNHNGYAHIILKKDGKSTTKTIHRLVAETFIPNPENKREVNHLNGIKNDNRVENLAWATKSENELHKYRVLGYKSAMCGKCGKRHPRAKIVQQLKNGQVIAEFYGVYEAQRETGIQYKNINAVCLGKRKSAGGFCWQYKNKLA